MTTRSKQWLIPAGLLALCFVPVVAGGSRLLELERGVVAPENARFLAHPVAIAIHIVSVSVYGVLGAFQFWPSFRKSKPRWHRLAGAVLIPFAFSSSLSGLWLTLFFPATESDRRGVFVIRLIVGLAMTAFLILAVDAIRRRRFEKHAEWMIRAYALGLGASTQVFTHLPILIEPVLQGELSRTLAMGSAWLINWSVAEWIIRREPSGRGDVVV